MPEWCLAGGAHAGTSTELGSAWLPVHSGAAPSVAKGGLPTKKEMKHMKFHNNLQGKLQNIYFYRALVY